MDDITYLKAYGHEEQYVAFADSAKRDKTAFVTPSEFALTWNTPFTLVTGIDIIDVSVPMSGYTISSSHNIVRFRFHTAGYDDDPYYKPPDWITASIKPGNHTPQTLMQELRSKLVDTKTSSRIDVRSASEPFEMQGKLVFVSEHPFEVDTVQSSLAAILGFSQLIDVTTSSQIAAFTDREQLDLATNETAMLTGSAATDRGFSLTQGRRMRQSFSASASSNLTKFEVMIVPFGDTSQLDNMVNMRVVNVRTQRTVLQGRVPVAYPAYSQLDMQTMMVARPNSDMFTATDKYWVEVYDDNNSDPNNCYRVCYGHGAASNSLRIVENEVEDAWYEPGCMMTARLYAVPFNYLLIPPGILNLASPVAYVMLRCAEIEKHMHSGRAFETSNMGLAVVNLSKGLYQEKFNVIAPKRSFHPIARLSRLTFRWEAPDGDLYDFLGVDNHISFVLRYYTLPARNTQIYSSANPQYKPDLFEWLNANEFADGDSSDEEDQEMAAPQQPALHRAL